MRIIGYITSSDSPNWDMEIEKVCNNFKQYKELLKNIENRNLTDEQIKKLYMCLLQEKNWFKVRTLEDLENYSSKRKEICQDILNGKDVKGKILGDFEILNAEERKAFAFLELSYGMDIEAAKNIVYKYGKDIEEISNGKHGQDDVVKEIRVLKAILKLSVDEVEKIYRENREKINMWKDFEYPTDVHVEEKALRLFEKLYSEAIKIEETPIGDVEYEGKKVKVSEITGDFKIFVRAEGAYNREWGEPRDWKEYYEKLEHFRKWKL